METTHIVTMKVTRRSGTSYYHFEANYSANQVAGRITFGFMKVADTLDESDINLFLFPENDQLMIYDHGRTYEGRITRIGQVDGAPYYGQLTDGAQVEFSIESAHFSTAQGCEEIDDEEDYEEEPPVVHINGKHLNFNGIPIDRTLDEFCSQLHGFELLDAAEDDRIYSGSYADRDATLYISANPETGMVYRVIVELEKKYLDGELGISDIIEDDYDEITEAFKKEYGEEYANEQYDFDDESAGDAGYEEAFMQEVMDGESCIGTTFQFESDESQWYSEVTVFLEFGHDDDDEESDSDLWYGCVNISFVDGENEPIQEDEEDE